MKMLQRIAEFERLAESPTPGIAQIGLKLLDQARRPVPQAITPAT